MAEPLQITKKQVIFLLLGVLAMAFLGVMAGSYFVKSRAGNDSGPKPGSNILLKVGQVLPNYTFMSLDGQHVDLYQTLEGKKSILIVLSTDCHPCGELANRFNKDYPKIGADCKVVGISFEPMTALIQYQKDKNLTFPLCQDTLGKFTGQYRIDSYPTLIGLNEKKEIAFIEFGNREEKGLKDYLKKL